MIALVLGLVLVVAWVTDEGRLAATRLTTRHLVVVAMLAASFTGLAIPWISVPTSAAAVVAAVGLALTLPVKHRTREPVSVLALLHDPRTMPTVIAVLLTCWLFVRNSMAGGLHQREVMAYGLSLLLLVAVGLVASRGGVEFRFLSQFFAGYIAAVALLGATLTTPWQPCRAGKCTVVGRIYTGIFPSENGMAIFAAFALLLVLNRPSSRPRNLQLIALTGLVVITGARTAAYALVGGLVVAQLLARLADRTRDGTVRLRSPHALLVAAGVTAASVALLALADTTTLSRRGTTWSLALEQVPIDSLAGAGTGQWTVMQAQGLLSIHFPHSQYLHLQFGGGLIALAIWVWFLSSLVHTVSAATKNTLGLRLAPTMFLAIAGATEIVWNPATVDTMTVLLVAVIAGSAASAPERAVAPNRAMAVPSSPRHSLPALVRSEGVDGVPERARARGAITRPTVAQASLFDHPPLAERLAAAHA